MKYFRIFIIVAAIAALTVGPASGQDLNQILQKANSLYKQGDYAGTIGELKKAVDLLKKGGNPAGAQQMQTNVGLNYIKLEKYDEAVAAIEEARKLYKKPDAAMDVKMSQLLALAHYNLGHLALRASILEGLIKKYPQLDEAQKAEIYAQLGDSYRRSEIHSKAVGNYQKALDIFTKLDNKEKMGLIYTAMGLSQAKLADFEAASDSQQKAAEIAEQLGKHLNLAEAYSNLGIIHWDRGQYPEALDFLTKAKEIEAKQDFKQNLGADFNNEGLVYKAVGDYVKALAAVEESIRIAREIDDKRSEAIALSNRALIHRIEGRNEEARKDYQAALAIYEAVSFKEGTASCHLGLGKLYEVHDNDYKKAYDEYQKALAMYRELGNLAYQAETLNQIGRLLRLSMDPARTSRDLLFEADEPAVLEIAPEEARQQSFDAYKEALDLAVKVNKKEAVWSAQQGLGYALRAEEKLEEALKYYKQAVETVVSIKGGSDSDLMANYLRDKEDLFNEAIDLLSVLFTKTNNPEYQRLMMEYQEIYKNEVIRVAMKAAKLEYGDSEKQNLFDQLNVALAKKNKLDDLAAQQQNLMEQKPAAEGEQAESEQLKKDLTAENQVVIKEAKKLDTTIAELLKQWKSKYPSDANMFDTTAKVDVTAIQKALGDDQALIQYFPLPDKLSILCVTKDAIKGAEARVPYADLASMIRDKFTYEIIELYGHQKTDLTEEQAYAYANKVLADLYQVLLAPVEKEIEGKSKLIIVPSKYIAYVPFTALVSGMEDGKPKYLVYDKTISYIRLSFFDQVFGRAKETEPFEQNQLLAVGNPAHRYLSAALPDLPGAEAEVKRAVDVARQHNIQTADALFFNDATETAWREKVNGQPYSIYYFATHGVPYAELVYDRRAKIEPGLNRWKEQVGEMEDEQKRKKLELRIKRFEAFENFCNQTFMSKSPLNGFLYMAYSGQEEDDGVLTLKEILELPDSVFTKANLAVLSACNTAVTYSPKVDDKIRQETESEEVNKELLAAGWTPGVDQICLADTFMKRNFNSVMGTLWFADDQATGFIIARFFENLVDAPPAEALRQAQLAYLERPPMGPEYTKVPRHPFYWAVSGIFGR